MIKDNPFFRTMLLNELSLTPCIALLGAMLFSRFLKQNKLNSFLLLAKQQIVFSNLYIHVYIIIILLCEMFVFSVVLLSVRRNLYTCHLSLHICILVYHTYMLPSQLDSYVQCCARLIILLKNKLIRREENCLITFSQNYIGLTYWIKETNNQNDGHHGIRILCYSYNLNYTLCIHYSKKLITIRIWRIH